MEIIYEVKVKKSFEDTIDALKKSLSEHNFGVLWELNFKDKLKEKGLDFDTNFKVFEVCNPKQAKEVLESHIEVGYFLPCKMVIYEKNNSVYVGMLRPTDLIGMFNDDSLVSIAKEVEKELKAAIDAI